MRTLLFKVDLLSPALGVQCYDLFTFAYDT